MRFIINICTPCGIFTAKELSKMVLLNDTLNYFISNI